MSMMNIVTTDVYDEWFKAIKEQRVLAGIEHRLKQVCKGNFGDHKSVGDGVYELRFRIGGGIRIYYTICGNELILLLAGGNKGTQKRDIARAKAICREED